MRSYTLKLALCCACIVLAAPDIAHANCEGPRPDIVWTYPDSSTLTVPPNAVFWAVAHVGQVRAEVDGVPLTRLAPEGVGRHQFSPAEELSEGTHELVVWSEPGEPGADPAATERRISFSVEAEPASSGDVAVSSVTVYPLVYSNGTGGLLSPPPDEYDLECFELAMGLEWSCNDIIPQSLARVTYEAEGAPVAYLVQGDILVPQGCASFWTAGGVESDPATFRAAAVLPTGLAEEHAFTGTIQERTLQDIYPDGLRKPGAAACSLEPGGPLRGHIERTLLLLLTACGSCLAARRSRGAAGTGSSERAR